ncbi:MAG: amino acid permease [Gemmatimonadaceae bacterium]|nr:amino acid permease [Gemmatimonadaceae bacterium]NUQ93269.1 amino acid permease [Gemmatimonadaceae bacterium]NUR19755.1 amino acid permease [Gemmatimonadaceae bacterium]NUS96347.1 amino acid permease [Gemmatimonadaceae bacterium]
MTRLTREDTVDGGRLAPAPARPSGAQLVRGLSLLGTVALVVGNMVGTSVYTLPASLAKETGPYGIVAWAFVAAGYFFVALVYSRLGTRFPRTGGPYVYARMAFGDFTGFVTVWSYWVSAIIGNAAIVTGAVGYVAGFSPLLESSPALRFGLALTLVWGLCLINVLGVRQSGRVQTAVMFLNLIPLALVAIASLFYFDPANLHPFAPNGLGSIAAGAALVVWAYSGIESATVPAEEVQAPERTIRRGTMIGYWVGTAIFLLTALAIAGSLPNATVAGSARPIAVAAEHALGSWAGAIVGLSAIAAALGTLNGWILMSGRIPLSAAEDGLFFRPLAAIHPRFHTPAVGLVVGAIVTSLMLTLYFSQTLLDAFNFIVLLSVLTTLLPHLLAAAAEFTLAGRGAAMPKLVAAIAFLFVLYTMYGVGWSVIGWGTLLVAAGLPLYPLLRRAGAPGARR